MELRETVYVAEKEERRGKNAFVEGERREGAGRVHVYEEKRRKRDSEECMFGRERDRKRDGRVYCV